MAIDPRTLRSAGTPSGQVFRTVDLDRRVRQLEAVRTKIGAINGATIAPGTIPGSAIVAASITASQITANTITANLIQANTITANQIAANTITAGEIAANTITATQIAASTITANQIQANTITANKIAANTITATQIAAHTITATEISVTTLSSLTANMGAITAGTITGATLQTSSSGAGVVIDGTGVQGFAATGRTPADRTFFIDAGSGAVTLTAVIIAQPGSNLPGNLITGTIPGISMPVLGGGNGVPNSGFENGTTGWTNSTNATLASVSGVGQFRNGAKGLRITSNASGDMRFRLVSTDNTTMMRVQEGDKISASGYSKASTTLGAPRSTRVRLGFYDSSFVAVGSTTLGTSVTNTTSSWTRAKLEAVTVPSTALYAIIYGEVLATAAAGEVHYWDDMQIEVSEVVTAYAPKVDEITPGSIGVTEIAPITIDAGSVKIGGVSSGTVLPNAITAGTIAPLAVTVGTIAPVAVTVGTIAPVAVTSGTIATGAVTAGTIAANAVTATTIAANAVTAAKIVANTITANEIAANTITANEIAANTLTAGEIAANAITASELAANAVTAAKILAGTITANEIASGAITANKLNVILGGGNFLQNSGFENATTPLDAWAPSIRQTADTVTTVFKKGFGIRAARSTVTSSTGTIYLVAPSASADFNEVVPGRTYTGSFWTRRGASNTGPAQNARATLQWRDASDVDITTTNGLTVAQSTTFQRCVVTGVAPAGAAKVRLITYSAIADAGNPAVGDIFYYDDAQLEEGDVPTSYAPRTDEILPGTVVANMIGADQINATHIAADSVGASEIIANSITAGEIATNTITASEIAANAITTSELNAGSVTAAKIVANTITANEIAANTITATEINTTSISAAILTAGSVTSNTLATGSIQAQHMSFTSGSLNMMPDAGFEQSTETPTWVSSSNSGYLKGPIAPATTPAAKSGNEYGIMTVGAGGVGATEVSVTRSANYRSPIQPGATYTFSVYVRQVAATANRQARIRVTWRDAAGSPVGSTQNGSYTALPTSTVTWTQLTFTGVVAPTTATQASFMISYATTTGTFAASGNVLHLDEAMMVPGSTVPATFLYREGEVQPGSVGNTVIGADAITTDKILAATILAGDIATNTITATQIAANTITATQIAAGAITASELSATAIDAMTITGATFRTSSSTSTKRVIMDSTGLYGRDTANTTTFRAGVNGALDIYGDSAVPPNERMLRFLDGTGGVVVANTWGRYVTGTNPQRIYQVNVETNSTDYGTIRLKATNGAGNAAMLELSQVYVGSGTNDVIAVTAGSTFKTLLTSAATSDYAFTPSDRVLKKNIGTLPAGALEKVRALTGRTFHWKKNEGPKGRQAGFIAQEVEEVFPEAVIETGRQDVKGLNTMALLGLLVEAFKEMDERLAKLEQ